MNTKEARLIKNFSLVLQRDRLGRPVLIEVPGHEGRRYQISLTRVDGHLVARCLLNGHLDCEGNSHSICYHSLAAVLLAAEKAGLRAAVCPDEASAERLARLGGQVLPLESAQSRRTAWLVVRGEDA